MRFGNVLASNGSVVPKFKAQIDAGGPVTVTDREMVRYFMTIRRGMRSGRHRIKSHALGPSRSDVSVYVLNMGQPVKILDLAERMIRLAGLEPGKDIDIVRSRAHVPASAYRRFCSREEGTDRRHRRGRCCCGAGPIQPSIDAMRGWLAMLDQGVTREEREAIYTGVLREAVPDFRGAAT